MSSEFEKTAKTIDRATLLRRGAALGGTLALGGFLPSLASARRASTTLNLVAYSTPKPVMAALIAAFQNTPAGEGVSFTQSYGPSTSQAQAVAAGLPCDIIFPSWPGDVQILVDAGLVNKNWNQQSYKGIVANTVVAFAVRHYNPKHIKGWNDLIKSGVQVITPDPFSSGSAKWNILAAYSAQRHLGKTDAQAQAYLEKLFKNVVAQPTSGSAGTAAFLSGEGDTFITYESEAIAATLKGTQVEYVIPRQTLLIELPIAVMQNSPNKDVANKFIQFLKSTSSQVVFGQNGFRPVNPAAAKQFKNFPVRPGQITLADKTLGGFAAAQARWFAQHKGLMYGIESAVGGPSS
jgi:sulfate/thiosulfate transport system substrate-binding protein